MRKSNWAHVERAHIGVPADSTAQLSANSQHQPPDTQVKTLPDDSSPQPSSHTCLQAFPVEAPFTLEQGQVIPTFLVWIPHPQDPQAFFKKKFYTINLRGGLFLSNVNWNTETETLSQNPQHLVWALTLSLHPASPKIAEVALSSYSYFWRSYYLTPIKSINQEAAAHLLCCPSFTHLFLWLRH